MNEVGLLVATVLRFAANVPLWVSCRADPDSAPSAGDLWLLAKMEVTTTVRCGRALGMAVGRIRPKGRRDESDRRWAVRRLCRRAAALAAAVDPEDLLTRRAESFYRLGKFREHLADETKPEMAGAIRRIVVREEWFYHTRRLACALAWGHLEERSAEASDAARISREDRA